MLRTLQLLSSQLTKNMAVKINVEGYEAFKAALKEHKGKTVFALFSGSVDSNGKSWCPDCVVGKFTYEQGRLLMKCYLVVSKRK